MGKYGDGHASGRVAWWWRLRPGLLVLVTLVALFVVLVVAPSTGAAGGCGGG